MTKNHPLVSHTIICAPMVTVGVPVGAYCRTMRFRATLASPFKKICAAAFTPASGSLNTPDFFYYSCSKVWLFMAIIGYSGWVVKGARLLFFDRIKSKDGGRWISVHIMRVYKIDSKILTNKKQFSLLSLYFVV